MSPHTPALALARVVGWLIVPLYVAGICTSYVLQRRAGLLDDNSVENVLLLVGFSAFAVVGALLVAKRPTNAIGWIMAVVALMVSIFLAGDSYAAYTMVIRGQPDALAVFGAWIGGWYWYALLVLVLVYLPLLFPDGRMPSRRWLPVAVLTGVGTLGMIVLGALAETLHLNEAPGYEIDNPIGIEGLGYVEDLPIFGVLTGLLFFGIIGAAASVVVRFLRSRGIERQQMKWFVYAVVPMLLIPTDGFLPGIISSVALSVVLIGLPTAIGIAILRYRLYDIDILINRTLVYGSLTATLIALYFGGIFLLQRIFVLELPSIGWQRFVLGSSQNHSTAFLSSLDTYATRLLTEPLTQRPAVHTCGRCIHPPDSCDVQPIASSPPVVHRPSLLQEEVRR
jgi:hypothetical protein